MNEGEGFFVLVVNSHPCSDFALMCLSSWAQSGVSSNGFIVKNLGQLFVLSLNMVQFYSTPSENRLEKPPTSPTSKNGPKNGLESSPTESQLEEGSNSPASSHGDKTGEKAKTGEEKCSLRDMFYCAVCRKKFKVCIFPFFL